MASMASNIAHGTPAYVTLHASFLRSTGPGGSGQSYNSEYLLFETQRNHWIESRRTRGRIGPEGQTDDGRNRAGKSSYPRTDKYRPATIEGHCHRGS